MKQITGLLVGIVVVFVFLFGGIFIAHRVRMNQMEKEHKQYVSEIGAKFEERLRELRIEAGLDPDEGCSEIIDMSHLFQKD